MNDDLKLFCDGFHILFYTNIMNCQLFKVNEFMSIYIDGQSLMFNDKIVNVQTLFFPLRMEIILVLIFYFGVF